MDDLSIHTLITIICGFSNATTMKALADKLGISYSTLNRSNKSGKWPRSVAIESMRMVFDECRDNVFGGDDEALAKSTLLQLRGLGIQTEWLEQALGLGGYDRFVSELITRAKSYDPQKPNNDEGEVPGDTSSVTIEPEPSKDPPATSEGTQSTHEPRLPILMAAIPAAIVFLLGLFNISLASAFTWMTQNQLTFCALSLLVAVLPVVVGACVDSPIAWRAYKHTHPDTPLSLPGFVRVAKYGDVDGISPEVGRFDFTKAFIVHQSLCNVLGAATYLSLFFLLLALPGFHDFFANHAWVEFFKLSISAGIIVAFEHMQDQLRATPTIDRSDAHGNDQRRNCDNFLPTRAHVWANAVHLAWTVSLIILFCLSLIAYGIVTFRTQAMPLFVLVPFGFAMLYFVCACVMPTRLRVDATCTGMFAPGVIATAAGMAALTVSCFVPTVGSALSCAVYATCATGAIAWQRYNANNPWLQSSRHAGAYSIAVTAVIAALVIIGILTSSFS